MSRPIPVSKLAHHPDNPPGRVEDVAELVASIRGCGVLAPLVVETHPSMEDWYVVVDGNRRLAAARAAGLFEVPCEVRPPRTARLHTRDRLVFNGHRLDMSPIEQARGFKAMTAEGMTPADVARVTGYSAAHVSHRLALLNLDEATQQRVEAGALPARVALEAIRTVTDRRRSPRGKSTKPLHFGAAHPLAGAAADRCKAAHNMSGAAGKVGGVACGPCWEEAIRADAIANPDRETAAS